VFGMQFPNSQLLADDFARNGFATYIPDYLNGDPVTQAMLDSAKGAGIPTEWIMHMGKRRLDRL